MAVSARPGRRRAGGRRARRCRRVTPMRKADAADERARAAESPRAEANKAAAGDCGAHASTVAGRADGGQPESGRR